MKRALGWWRSRLRRLRQKTLHERMLVFLVGLLTLACAFTGYFYYTDIELNQVVAQERATQELVVESTLLDEALIHAQLEISELSQGKPETRAQDAEEFGRYKQVLETRIRLIHDFSTTHAGALPAEMVERIQYLHDSYPGLDQVWKGFVRFAETSSDHAKTEEAYQGVIGYFDQIGFNRVVLDIVKIGAVQCYQAETRMQAMARNQRLVMLASTTLIFLLGLIVFFLHKKAVEGQVHELQLAHASKLASLGELSAGVAHELNSPLMFIQGYNNRVRSALRQADFDPDSEVWQHIEEVNDGVGRITKIIRHFRDFSRQTNVKKMESKSINEVIDNSFILLNERIKQYGIEVKKELSPDQPWVLCNADRLEQVFINLLNNAVDALTGSAEHPTITVRSLIEGDEVIVEVLDNGPGVPSDVQARIFDPFFTTKPLGKGTGLGLSISQGIIRDHQGSISVHSAAGEETCFVIRLPLERAAGLASDLSKDVA